MEDSKATAWFQEMYNLWRNKEPERIEALLADGCQYFEDPYQEPLTTLASVVAEWQGINDQEILELEYQILWADATRALVEYRFVSRGAGGATRESRGGQYVEVNEYGQAILFKQWWQ